jgi:hypothetical protein
MYVMIADGAKMQKLWKFIVALRGRDNRLDAGSED